MQPLTCPLKYKRARAHLSAILRRHLSTRRSWHHVVEMWLLSHAPSLVLALALLSIKLIVDFFVELRDDRAPRTPTPAPFLLEKPVAVYRKEFDLLVEAHSYEEATQAFDQFIGSELRPAGACVFVDKIDGFKGDDQPSYDEVNGRPYFPKKATLIVSAHELAEAEAVFTDLDGSFTWDHYFREVSFTKSDRPAQKYWTREPSLR